MTDQKKSIWEAQAKKLLELVDGEVVRALMQADPVETCALFERLEPVEREVLCALYGEELTREQLAHRLGVSRAWLDRAHRRALWMFRVKICLRE
jgi:DNA-directed RNA polymerase specialized sigma subunit